MGINRPTVYKMVKFVLRHMNCVGQKSLFAGSFQAKTEKYLHDSAASCVI